jgi:hypothetical protein
MPANELAEALPGRAIAVGRGDGRMSQMPRGLDGSSFDGMEILTDASGSVEVFAPVTRRGDVGIFAGDWACYQAPGGHRSQSGSSVYW